MTDNKKERTIRDILSDEVERQLEKNPPAKPSFEEFREMVYRRMKNDKEGDDASEEGDNIMPVETKNIKRILRTAGVAAGFVMAMLAGMFAMNSLNSEVGADKNPKEEIVTEDGVIIEDGGWGSSEGEENVWVITEWHDVEGAKLTYPNLLIPGYVPNGYEFECLIVESLDYRNVFSEYTFIKNKRNKIEIEVFDTDNDTKTSILNESDEVIKSEKGNTYINVEEKSAVIVQNDGNVITIYGILDRKEILKIVNNLNN